MTADLKDTLALVVTAPIGDLLPVVKDEEIAVTLGGSDTPKICRVDLSSMVSAGDCKALMTAIGCVETELAGLPQSPSALFAFAPIPLLAGLGRLLGDKSTCDVYDRHRRRDSWIWESESSELKWECCFPPAPAAVGDVVVLLSVSGEVRAEEIPETLRQQGCPVYALLLPEPRPNIIRSRADLVGFIEAWRGLMARIRARHGAGVVVHLLPATPLSVSIEVGRRLLPKIDPKIRVYDSTGGRFQYCLSLGADGVFREKRNGESRRRFIFVSASPRQEEPLAVDHEFRRIRTALAQAERDGSIEVREESAASYDDLESALREFKPHVLHLSCHADSSGTLLLADLCNESEGIPCDMFEQLMREFSDDLELVVLNACFSEVIAERLPPDIPSSIGMNGEIDDDAAIDFSRTLYSSLAAGEEIPRAFALARNRLRSHGVEDLAKIFGREHL